MPKNLLVADDSLTIRKVIGMIFSTEDFVVTAVDNGLDAITRIRELRPDIVLADVMMPGKSGYEVCEALKSDPATQHIPVVLLAGTFEAFDENRARAARADDHVTKPFESQVLLDKVRALVGQKVGESQPAPAAPATVARPQAPVGVPARPAAPSFAPPSVGAPRPGFVPGVPPTPGMARPPGMGVPPPPGMARPVGVPPPPGMARPVGMPPPGGYPPPAARPGVPPPGGYPPPGMARPVGVPSPGGYPPPGAGRPGVPPPGMARPGVPPGMGAPQIPGGFPRAPGAAPLPAGVLPPAAAPRARDPFGLGGPGVQAPASHARPAPTESFSIEESFENVAPVAARPAPSSRDGGEAVLRDALSRASREVIEKIAWEVVPQLAETIIREELERLIKDRETQH